MRTPNRPRSICEQVQSVQPVEVECVSDLQQTSPSILPSGPACKILRAAEAEAWRDGYRFLAAATAAAEQIRREADTVYQARYAQGYANGRADGARESTRLVSDTVAKVDRYLAGLDRDIARLVIDIVRRILSEFDAVDLVLRSASRAVADFRREKSLKITVHPEALDRARAALASPEGHGLGPVITVEGDPRFDRSTCTVSTEFAVVDAGIDAQLAAIMEAFNISEEPPGDQA
jgi:type III secretion protein L